MMLSSPECPQCRTEIVTNQNDYERSNKRSTLCDVCVRVNAAHQAGILIGEQRATQKILKLLRVDWHREGNPEDYIEQHIENHAGGREGDNG